MRNEYTDYIAHGHKYFAVVDLGKKNSKGTKLRRYFYSANEYKNYLAGKKTLDDKLLGGVSKAYKAVTGAKALVKGASKASKAIRATNKEVNAMKKQGLTEEQARDEIRAKSTHQHMARAGLESHDANGYVIGYDKETGQRYVSKRGSRKLAKVVDNDMRNYEHAKSYADKLANSETKRRKGVVENNSYDEINSSNLISKQKEKEKEKNKYKDISKNTVKKPDQVPAILKPAQAAGERIRENFIERMVEKGINKANAEAMRKKLEETYQRATKISTSANNLKTRLDSLQEAFTSGDGDKALDAIDETLKDQEAIQKDILTIVDEMMPEAKKVADTFLDMGKKTLDTATAGPKAVSGDAVDEYLKEHGMTKEGVSKEFLDELRENLKRNRK